MFGKREARVDPAALRDVALFSGFSDAELQRDRRSPTASEEEA